jgi:hypothetical protein
VLGCKTPQTKCPTTAFSVATEEKFWRGLTLLIAARTTRRELFLLSIAASALRT